MKTLSIILFTALIAGGLCFCGGWRWSVQYNYDLGLADGKAIGWVEGYSYIKPIEDLQRQVGADPDGKLGPMWTESETQGKYEMAWQEQCAGLSFYPQKRKYIQAMLCRIEETQK